MFWPDVLVSHDFLYFFPCPTTYPWFCILVRGVSVQQILKKPWRDFSKVKDKVLFLTGHKILWTKRCSSFLRSQEGVRIWKCLSHIVLVHLACHLRWGGDPTDLKTDGPLHRVIAVLGERTKLDGILLLGKLCRESVASSVFSLFLPLYFSCHRCSLDPWDFVT